MSALEDYLYRNIPEYYEGMYLDGYTPNQILYAKRKAMREEAGWRQEMEHSLQEALKKVLGDWLKN